MKNIISEKALVVVLLCSFLMLFIIIALFSEATFDAGDGIRHYQIARYAWSHPFLFLDSWGKPFFTLVCSPFAQFGLMGAVFFNILCGIGTAFLAFKICKKLEMEHAWLAIIFVLFTTGYFPTLISGLTEPFFGLVLITSVYGFLCRKYVLSSVLISFLPLIRTEGYLILPFFFFILLYRKQYFQILFLATGTLVYSLIGLVFLKDFLWIKNQNPYNGVNKEFYGQGDLLHFVHSHNYIWGTVLLILFLAGISALLFNFLKLKRNTVKVRSTCFPEELVLIFGVFAVYFIVHSIMWWQGWANSLGLLRVMAAVLPCTAILAVKGINLLMINPIKNNPKIKNTVLLMVLFMTIRSPFKHEYFPFEFQAEQRLVNESGEWFKKSPFNKQRLYFLYPYLAHVLNVDAFDPKKVCDLWGLYPTIKKSGIDAVPDSSIVFWDSHFGPNECRIPLSKIIEDKNFKLIKSFVPVERFTTLGGSAFEIHVFMKVHKPGGMSELKSKRFDFETSETQNPTGELDSSRSFSGNKCLKIISTNVYAGSVNFSINEIPLNTLQCKLSARIYNPNADSLKLVVVNSFNDQNNNNLMYEGKNIMIQQSVTNKDWYLVETICTLIPSSYASKTNNFGFYLWNIDHKTFYADDIELHFIGKD